MKIKPHYKYITLLTVLLFFIAMFVFWNYFYPAHLAFQEQLQLFEFTKAFFLDVIVKPAGLAEYISRFLVQFFCVENLAALVMSLLLTLIYFVTLKLYDKPAEDAKRKWTGMLLRYSLATLPALMACAFMTSIDAKPTLLVSLLIALACVWLTETATKTCKPLIRIITSVIVSIVLVFLIGSAFIVYTFAVLGRMAWNAIFEKNWKLACVSVVTALVTWGVMLIVIGRLYPYPLDLLTWGDYYNRFVYVKADFNTSTWWVTIAIAIIFSRLKPAIWQCVAPVAICLGIYFIYDEYSEQEESMLDSLNMEHQERWDDIIAKSQSHAPATSYEMTALNLALAMKGQLADRYFTMRQFGVDGLLPSYQFDYMTPLLAADAYYQMGMINTAQRFYYESMESIADHQKSARLIKQLAMTALANGRIHLAQGYLRKLSHTLYYSDWAETMMEYVKHPERIDSNPELHRLRTQRTKQDSFFVDTNQPPLIAEMLNGNSDNTPAWQYLFTMLMVEGRLDDLMQTANFYEHNLPGKLLPIHVQEALLFNWVTKTGGLNGFPFHVSPQVGQRFMEFAQAAHQSRDVAEPTVRNQFGDTFWCYALLDAPAQHPASQQTDGTTSASAQHSPRE